MKKSGFFVFVKKYGMLAAGCVFYSLAIALFLDAYDLASGGVTGIAIILNTFIPLDTGYLIIIINVPLFVLGLVYFGKKFAVSTVCSTVISSLLTELWIWAFRDHMPQFSSLLLPSAIGGALFGAGMGLIFRAGSSTGGTDIIVKILRKKFRYLKTGVISMIIDVVIIAASVAVFRDIELLCYTVISIIATTLVFDWVLYGGNSAKLVYIITAEDFCAPICDKILKELDVGATVIDGEGAYTGDRRRIVMCAIRNVLYPKLRDIVREEDPHAFMIVSSAKEIYGEGYKGHTDEDL